MSLSEFLSALKALRAIGRHELEAAAPPTGTRGWSDDSWVSFRNNPAVWLLIASPADQAAVWGIVQRRMKPKAPLSNLAAHLKSHSSLGQCPTCGGWGQFCHCQIITPEAGEKE